MFAEEALWIRRSVETLRLPTGAKVADVGSSDLLYRTRIQPHVQEHVYLPLLEKGVKVVSCDAKSELGVDVVADLCSQERTLRETIGEVFDLVLCANMLEHVGDRSRAIRSLLSIAKPGGHLLLTVPRTYFYHEDPIDTMYRPSPEQLFGEIRAHCECSTMAAHILPITQKSYYVMPVYPSKLMHNLPFFAYRQAWRWVIKPLRWKVTCLLLTIGKVHAFARVPQT